MTAGAAVVAVALLLSTITSCGNHATSSPPPSPVNTTSAFSPPPTTHAAPSLASLEKAFACANTIDMGPGNGATDEVQCILHAGGWQQGETLDLATFTSPANEHSWANITTHIAGWATAPASWSPAHWTVPLSSRTWTLAVRS